MEGQQHLTAHFCLEEFTQSATAAKHGICNEPPIEAISNLQNLCQQVLEPLREHYGRPIHISSGYRSRDLNRLVGGVAGSQHLKGEAADILLPSVRQGREWYRWIRDHCTYDQLLLERNTAGQYWIHVSCKRDLSQNRMVSAEYKK